MTRLAVVFLVLGATFFIFFGLVNDYSQMGQYASYVKLTRIWDAVLISLAGFVLLFRGWLVKRSVLRDSLQSNQLDEVSPIDRTQGKLFGKTIDLILVQASLIFSVVLFHKSDILSFAYIACLVVILNGRFIATLGRPFFGYFGSLFGIGYLLYRHFFFDNHSMRYAAKRLRETLEQGPFDISLVPYVFLLALSVAIPHLQMIRLGSLQFGCLRGDVAFEVSNHKIFIPITSALVFIVIYDGFITPISYVWNLVRILLF